VGRVTPVKLGPLASGTNFTASVKVAFMDGTFVEEKISFATKADDFEIIRVDDETACVRIRNKKNANESFTVSMDRASLGSYEGFSDDFQTLNAMQGPFTFACFYDLEPEQEYNFNLVARTDGMVTKRAEKQVNTIDFDPNARNMVEYTENDENNKWREQYNKWRLQTFNVWAVSFVKYQIQLSTELDLTPRPERCPLEVVRPHCDVTLQLHVDYNGCLFFVCNQPKTKGAILASELNAYKADNEIFATYLLPEWETLMTKYNKESSQDD